jgi:hypothetical protein
MIFNYVIKINEVETIIDNWKFFMNEQKILTATKKGRPSINSKLPNVPVNQGTNLTLVR